ncbi:hypothetical protein [Roseovarius salinarum]|uniref:hypothetical protein n=1 Tax=Roseovarius salinarum TaxID=1981892 RepID=UPI000C3440CD|nr:hypothetical protein [Roseovarius salinarum]
MSDCPDRRLWCAVLGAALHDAARGKESGWIGSRDFHTVCALVGIDPDAVAERLAPPSKAT